jgi:hypothetical protein
VAIHDFPKFHDPEVWGADAEVFRPSRFEGKVLTWEFVQFWRVEGLSCATASDYAGYLLVSKDGKRV